MLVHYKFAAASAFMAVLGTAAPSVTPPVCSPRTEPVGDGDPHQNYYNVQVTDNMACGEEACSVSYLTSYTIGWSASGNVGSWITGGFSVSESYTTGSNYGCNGNAGDTICVWDNVAHTAYTVQDTGVGPGCSGLGSPVVVKSPNTDNQGGNYYCGKNEQCSFNGANYWNDNGPAGGPQ